MTPASERAINGEYGFVLATYDRAHGLSFWNVDFGFGPLFSATVFGEGEVAVVDLPIADDQAEWLAMPAPLSSEPRP